MNIYNSSNLNSNNNFGDLQVGNLDITGGLTINGASRGDILICENNTNDIGGLELGLQDMVLCSDRNNTGIPIWRNNITLNTLNCNDININGVQVGDLLVGGAQSAIARLPVGLDNQVLFSNGAQLGWQSLSVLNNSIYVNGPLSLPETTQVIYTNNTINVISGRDYKITLNAQITLTDLVQLSFNVNNIFSRNGTYNSNGDVNIMFIYQALSTGALTLTLSGQVTPTESATLTALTITVEEF
jgi:hypothetical protein